MGAPGTSRPISATTSSTAPAPSNPLKVGKKRGRGGHVGGNGRSGLAAGGAARSIEEAEGEAVKRLRAGVSTAAAGEGNSSGGTPGVGGIVLETPPLSSSGEGEVSSEEGGSGKLGWEVIGGTSSDSESGEGRWDMPRDSRGSSSLRRESKTSFHDGVLEVVAVEGVLHLGQIQVSTWFPPSLFIFFPLCFYSSSPLSILGVFFLYYRSHEVLPPHLLFFTRSALLCFRCRGRKTTIYCCSWIRVELLYFISTHICRCTVSACCGDMFGRLNFA